MKTLLKKTTVLLALASASAIPPLYADDHLEYVALPGAVHLDGVGTLYGGVAGIKKLGKHKLNLYVGIAGGDASAFGFAVTDIPLFNGKLSYVYAQAADAVIDTQYQRGTEFGSVYQQDLSGNAHAFTLTHQLPFKHLSSTLSLTRSSVSLEGYADDDGNDISFGQSGLHDIETTSIGAKLTWDNRSGPTGLTTGNKISSGFIVDTGRIGQSDQVKIEYQLSHHRALGNNALASFYLNGSHAFILSEATKFDTADEVRDALNADCDQVSDPTEQSRCLQLEQDLTAYITASNTEGTAKAVGGSQGLRSYQESFFRGANSLVEGVELQWQLPSALQLSSAAKLQWIGFIEGAQVADDFGDLSSNSRYSIGTGLRAYVGDIPARMEFSHGEEGNAFLISAGLVF